MVDIMYNGLDYQAEFKNYLEFKEYGSATVKKHIEYLSAFIDFVHELEPSKSFYQSPVEDIVTFRALQQYINKLSKDKSQATIVTEHVSSLDLFCVFCIQKGWMKKNVVKTIPLAKVLALRSKQSHHKREVQFSLEDFQKDLTQDGINKHTVKSYSYDINEFLQINN